MFVQGPSQRKQTSVQTILFANELVKVRSSISNTSVGGGGGGGGGGVAAIGTHCPDCCVTLCDIIHLLTSGVLSVHKWSHFLAWSIHFFNCL